MNKIWIILILAITIGWIWYESQKTVPQPSYYDPEIVHLDEKKYPISSTKRDELKDVINIINERNAKISTLVYNNVEIELKLNILSRRTFHLNALIAYEKPGNLRIITRSKHGKETETDTGFNTDIFWLYSRNFDRGPALYYSKRNDLHKTGLKSIYNPYWIVESLSVGKVDLEKADIVKYMDHIHIIQPRISLQGKSVTKVTSIDPKKKVILGHYIYDSKNRIITSTEIMSFYEINGHVVPKSMRIVWSEGQMKWELKNPLINKPVSPGMFDLPNITPKVMLTP